MADDLPNVKAAPLEGVPAPAVAAAAVCSECGRQLAPGDRKVHVACRRARKTRLQRRARWRRRA